MPVGQGTLLPQRGTNPPSDQSLVELLGSKELPIFGDGWYWPTASWPSAMPVLRRKGNQPQQCGMPPGALRAPGGRAATQLLKNHGVLWFSCCCPFWMVFFMFVCVFLCFCCCFAFVVTANTWMLCCFLCYCFRAPEPDGWIWPNSFRLLMSIFE